MEAAVHLPLSQFHVSLFCFVVPKCGSVLGGTQLDIANELSLGTDLGERTDSSLFLSSEILDSVGKAQGSGFTVLSESMLLSQSLAQYCGLHTSAVFLSTPLKSI